MKDASAKLLNSMLKAVDLPSEFCNRITAAADEIVRRIRGGGNIYICGSGGSASDSEHIVGEMVKSFLIKRPISPKFKENFLQSFQGDTELVQKLEEGVKAFSLVSQTSLITAINNDLGGEYIFSQQAYVYCGESDVLIGISTSGNSGAVVNAFKVAKIKGTYLMGLTGKGGGKFEGICDILFKADDTETYKVQQTHLALYHILCAVIEREMFGE